MLTPLQAPHLLSNHQQQAPDDHDDTDLDDLDDMADDNADDEDSSGVGHSQTAESAAREVTAYSALCDDLEEAVFQYQCYLELLNVATKNISSLFPLKHGSYVIMHTAVWFYIGEVLDLYRKGSNSRYGSMQSTMSVSTLSFLSLQVYLPLETSAAASDADETLYEDDTDYKIHTHAPASSILYHIGKRALKGTNMWALELSNANARHWIALTAPQVKQKLPRLKISGGRIMKA
ncbi:hypothetical protein EV702DRAFT_1198151 [Suillus placidus]|uniref:Uncharacterized protein n=1 Tax=Suillus placidus TaxID=48579 RepID=A0A9P6ZTG1_9AGAM|nr:hypothetical protein EV702DRAFT_1198151 [Suillus placidus]